MVGMAPGIILRVERGPDWLFVKIGGPDSSTPSANSQASPPLAEEIWSLLERNFTYRLVLECEELYPLDSECIGQLVLLQKKLAQQGGVMRLCGLREPARQSLTHARLDARMPNFRDRAEAIMGARPTQPR